MAGPFRAEILIFAAVALVVSAPRLYTQTPEQALPSKAEAVAQAIGSAYASCFRDFEIEGQTFHLRIPFGENGERVNGGIFQQQIAFGGKAGPQAIWPRVASLLASEDFRDYVDALSQPGEKVVLLYIDTDSWTVISNPDELRRVDLEWYPDTRTEVCVIKDGSELLTEDIYNYLYCIGSVGMDCSGFVYFIQQSIARALGADLDEMVGNALGVPTTLASQVVGCGRRGR